ncbi:hypothetical protein QR680_018113 [Steinernema hermaphroditum]|uniref:NAD-dependent epimerase/dehydratase domain-containing protein n=1 Tax=Steinernema hermaphroditum TaxID=289476 RepID=A0AA39HGX6_9BILA|nr:hypothetical protein QR680_018113 [Steinernema hermaphroditum]
MTDRASKKVLVTGASGYVALHCVRQLLEDGYAVRGTVRSLNNQKKIAPLRSLKGAADRLELVEADLERPDDWPQAIEGCVYILHVASPWPIVADEHTITVAVDGTMIVLRAASKCGGVKKVVMTSSCAAINDGHKNDECVFDESCWTNLENKHVENYARSKTLAERSAWNFWNSLNGRERFELTVINPTFVTGPVLSDQEHGSATVIGRMMNMRTYLASPKICLGVVDVRDVAVAHIRALERPETNGQRILVTHTSPVWFGDMANWLHEEFSPRGYRISKIVTPTWLLKVYAKLNIDEQAKSVVHRVGPELRFANQKSVELLGMNYVAPKDSVVAMMHSMIKQRMVKPPAVGCRMIPRRSNEAEPEHKEEEPSVAA